jgi:hypothetical protein
MLERNNVVNLVIAENSKLQVLIISNHSDHLALQSQPEWRTRFSAEILLEKWSFIWQGRMDLKRA